MLNVKSSFSELKEFAIANNLEIVGDKRKKASYLLAVESHLQTVEVPAPEVVEVDEVDYEESVDYAWHDQGDRDYEEYPANPTPQKVEVDEKVDCENYWLDHPYYEPQDDSKPVEKVSSAIVIYPLVMMLTAVICAVLYGVVAVVVLLQKFTKKLAIARATRLLINSSDQSLESSTIIAT